MLEFLVICLPPGIPQGGAAWQKIFASANGLLRWPIPLAGPSASIEIQLRAQEITCVLPKNGVNPPAANVPALIYVPSISEHESVVFTAEGGDTYFQRLDIYVRTKNDPLNKWKEEDDRSLLLADLYRRLYFRVDQTACEDPTGINLVWGKPNVCNAAWNPLVFCFESDGEELSAPAPGKAGLRAALQGLFQANGCLVEVMPLVSREEDLRTAILATAQPKHSDALMARLMWPTKTPCQDQWLPFYCLDLLKGRFHARPHVVNGQEGARWEWQWSMPDDATQVRGNREWFANYWLSRWKMQPPEEPAAEILPRDQVAVPLDADPSLMDEDWQTVQAEENVWPHKIKDILQLLQQSDTLEIQTMLQTFVGAIDRRKPHEPQRLEQHKRRFLASSQGRLVAKMHALIEAMCLDHFVPRSCVWIELPPPEVVPESGREQYRRSLDGKVVDLRRSVGWPGTTFARLLLAAQLEDNGQDSQPADSWYLKYRSGWWKDWFSGLFRHPSSSGMIFTFPEERGFLIGTSRLGGGRSLGTNPYRQEEVNAGIVLP